MNMINNLKFLIIVIWFVFYVSVSWPLREFLHKKLLHDQIGTERDLEASKKIATNNGAKTKSPGED